MEKTEKKTENANTLKYVSLITLTLQNAILALSMRYSRTREGDMYISSTAVVMSEIVKLVIALIIVFFEEGKDVIRFKDALHTTVIKNPIDTIKICVPAFVYIIQNNLLYVSSSHLDAATYQVTYQLKILTTAMFAVLLLRKKLLLTQWGSLFALVTGVVLVQLSSSTTAKAVNGHEQNRLIGFSAALGACVLSGFAGIYLEKMLKGADISVWMRNVQMSLLSIPFGVITCLCSEFNKIHSEGFFFGYDLFVWYVVLLQAGGGLIVAMVVKYADNILKGFATSLAIIIACVASMLFFNFTLTIQFAAGAAIVIGSIFLYSYDPNAKKAIQRTPSSERKTSYVPDEDDIEQMEQLQKLDAAKV